MFTTQDVRGLLDTFKAELTETAALVASGTIGRDDPRRGVLGERAIRLAVAETITSRPVAAKDWQAEGKTLAKLKSVMSQARRAVKLAREADDPILYQWLEPSDDTPSMWDYLKERTPKPDKIEKAFEIVEEYLVSADPDETDRLVARVTLAREQLSNAAQRLADTLNH